jgi:hypothetical protein
MKYLKSYENYFYDKSIKVENNGRKISFVYDKEIIADFFIRGNNAIVQGYDVLESFGKGKGVDFLLYAIEKLKEYGIENLISYERGRNEHSQALWDKIKKIKNVETGKLKRKWCVEKFYKIKL